MVFGEGHLRHLVETYVRYFNTVRPHRGRGHVPIGIGKKPAPEAVQVRDGIACESWLGGVLKHYRRTG